MAKKIKNEDILAKFNGKQELAKLVLKIKDNDKIVKKGFNLLHVMEARAQIERIKLRLK